MSHLNIKTASVTLLVGMLSLTSYPSQTKADPSDPATQPSMSITTTTQEGVAGGISEATFTASASVSAVDSDKRTVTLTTDDGRNVTFKAGPEIKNFDQIHVGDTVVVTITERIVIFVRSDGADPSVTHAAALATAPKGAKPGALVAQTFEIVATVKSIDSTDHSAVLQFADGQTKTVKVRPDVDLSQYKNGDSVVIRVTDALSLIVQK